MGRMFTRYSVVDLLVVKSRFWVLIMRIASLQEVVTLVRIAGNIMSAIVQCVLMVNSLQLLAVPVQEIPFHIQTRLQE